MSATESTSFPSALAFGVPSPLIVGYDNHHISSHHTLDHQQTHRL